MMTSRRWSNLTKLIVAGVLVVLAIVLLITFRVLIGPTVVAFVLAFFLSYPVAWVQRSTGWARPIAISGVYLVMLIAAVLMPVLVVPRLAVQVSSLQATLEGLIFDLQSVSTGPLLVLGSYEFSPDMLLQQAGELLANLLVAATGNPLSLARGVTNSLISIVYVLVLTFWILKDIYKIQRLAMDQIPVDYQEDVRRLGQELGQVWHAFVRGQLTLALTVGLLTWLPLTILGMPNAGGLALLAGLMEFLPSIGPGISGTVGTLFALFQGSTWLPISNLAFAVIIGLTYGIIGQIESIFLIPRLVGGQVRLHPAVAFVAIIAGTFVFGLLGVLLATPITASARVILAYVYRKLFDLEPFEPLKTPQASLRIPGLIAGRKIEGVIFDLDGTLAQLDWQATGWARQNMLWMDRLVAPEQRAEDVRRLMVVTEGIINFIVSQARITDRYRAQGRRLEEESAWLNLLRGYPPVELLQPQPGVVALVETLARQYRLVIVSTRPRAEILCFLEKAGLEPDLFACLLGRESTRNLLPNGEPLQLAAAELELQPSQMLMVSDTDSNLRSARALEMATVGTLSGLGEAEDLAESDLVLGTTAELAEWL
jgi:predicted PurR-regulated permease PerM/phosphoglycolate phosphatase-like HAD superfamily hydrolase